MTGRIGLVGGSRLRAFPTSPPKTLNGVINGSSDVIGSLDLLLFYAEIFGQSEVTSELHPFRAIRGAVAGSGAASADMYVTRHREFEVFTYAAVAALIERQMAGWVTYINDPEQPIVNPPEIELEGVEDPVSRQTTHFV